MLVRQDWRDTFQPGAGELARRIRGVAFAGGMRAIEMTEQIARVHADV
jgi:hypothetical protein